jgi:hypothetical protein
VRSVNGKDVRGVRGFYVTDTDETIALARPLPERLANPNSRESFDDKGLFEMDRKEGIRFAIGPSRMRLKAQSAKQGRLDAKARTAAAGTGPGRSLGAHGLVGLSSAVRGPRAHGPPTEMLAAKCSASTETVTLGEQR